MKKIISYLMIFVLIVQIVSGVATYNATVIYSALGKGVAGTQSHIFITPEEAEVFNLGQYMSDNPMYSVYADNSGDIDMTGEYGHPPVLIHPEDLRTILYSGDDSTQLPPRVEDLEGWTDQGPSTIVGVTTEFMFDTDNNAIFSITVVENPNDPSTWPVDIGRISAVKINENSTMQKSIIEGETYGIQASEISVDMYVSDKDSSYTPGFHEAMVDPERIFSYTTNVNTKVPGTYQTTLHVTSGDNIYNAQVFDSVTFDVEVTDNGISTIYIQNDTQHDTGVVDAPRSQDELYNLFNISAFNMAKNTFLENSEITLVDDAGYDFDDPQVGTYDMSIQAVDGVKHTEAAFTLIVHEDPYETVDVEFEGINPLTYVLSSAPATLEEVMADANIELVTSINGVEQERIPVTVDDIIEVSGNEDNAYNPAVTGQYPIFLEKSSPLTGATYNTTLYVYVLPNMNQPMIINTHDNEVGTRVAPKSDVDVVKALGVSAFDMTAGIYLEDEDIIVTNNDGYDYTNPVVGDFTFDFSAQSPNGGIETIETATLSVTQDPVPGTAVVLTGTSTSTGTSNAPTSEEELKRMMSVVAFDEATSTFLTTDEIAVTNTDTYDYTNPVVGTYNFTFTATNANSVVSNTVDVVLTVEEDVITGGSDVLITASDSEIGTLSAPTTEEELIHAMNVVAFDEATLSFLGADAITVTNTDGYDYTNPQVGTFNFSFVANTAQKTTSEAIDASITINQDLTNPDAKVTMRGFDSITDTTYAPKSDDELIKELGVTAYNTNADDYIENTNIEITNNDGYDYTNPQAGTYTFSFVALEDGLSDTFDGTLTIEDVIAPTEPGTDPDVDPDTETDTCDKDNGNSDSSNNEDEIVLAKTGRSLFK